ncbi:hypothetical protein JCM8208_003640 [Rhodotorula glutinis]
MLRAILHFATLFVIATSTCALPIPSYAGALDLLPFKASIGNSPQRDFGLPRAPATLRIVEDDDEHLPVASLSAPTASTGRPTSHASLHALVAESTALAAPAHPSAAAVSGAHGRKAVDFDDDSIFSDAIYFEYSADVVAATTSAAAQDNAVEMERARQLEREGWSKVAKRELGQLKAASKRTQQLRARTAAVAAAAVAYPA